SYTLPWTAGIVDRADFAAALQARLAEQGAPFHELEERQTTLEAVYLRAMNMADAPPHPAGPLRVRATFPGKRGREADLPGQRGGEGLSTPDLPGERGREGISAPRMFASLRQQGDMLRHSLPFYVSSWWRRGDLSWVLYLNAFVLLLVAATSLFGQLPGVAGQVAQRIAGGSALQAGLLLPLF